VRTPWAPRDPAPEVPLARGERLLAWATGPSGTVVGGTRDALYVDGARLAWETLEAAEWDSEEEVLSVREVGTWGQARPEHVLRLDDPARLLQLVRERVTASIVWQRHVPVRRTKGLRVIARCAPARREDVSWVFEFDEGIDPDDPVVRLTAERALDQARADVGLG